jgi:Gas vesicle synthesis protein GvpO
MSGTDTEQKDRAEERSEKQESDRDKGSGRQSEKSAKPSRGKHAGGRGHGRDGTKRQRRPADFDLIEKGVVQLAALTGREPESVSGIAPMEEGWQLTVDVIELERIPPSTNVTATYEAELDEQGNLVGYRRMGRYYRNQPLEE